MHIWVCVRVEVQSVRWKCERDVKQLDFGRVRFSTSERRRIMQQFMHGSSNSRLVGREEALSTIILDRSEAQERREWYETPVDVLFADLNGNPRCAKSSKHVNMLRNEI